MQVHARPLPGSASSPTSPGVPSAKAASAGFQVGTPGPTGCGTALAELVSSAGTVQATGRELLHLIGCGRAFLAGKGLKKGDRCVLLSQNSTRWIAMDLAVMAEGLIAVPFYVRQAPAQPQPSAVQIPQPREPSPEERRLINAY